MNFNEDEFLICTIATLLSNSRHVAVGMASAIPGSASLLAREERKSQRNSLRVSMIGGDTNNPFTDGGRELFDCSGQGRIDTFFWVAFKLTGKPMLTSSEPGNTQG